MEIIQVPFSGGGLGKGNGANLAPDKIMSALDRNSDIIEVYENDIVRSHDNIYEYVLNIKEPSLFIGGDHSITYPIVKALKDKIKTLIVFDAHPDLMDNFRPPTHEDYLRVIIEEHIIEAKDIVLVGVRKLDKIEQKYIDDKNIKVYTYEEIKKKGILDFAKELTGLKSVYLSFDIDVITPADAPGTGYREKGGLCSRSILRILDVLKANIVFADVVEVNPLNDIDDKTSKLAAKIIRKIID